MKFDAVIFDVDGTIWDSTDVAAAAYNVVFERAGIDVRVDGDRLKQLFGKPMDEIFRTLLPNETQERLHRYGLEAMDLENEVLANEGASYYPGIRDVFEILSKRVPLFIVSNCQCGYIEVVMDKGDLTPFVKGHLCFGDTGTGKGQTLLKLIEKYDLKCPVYVGDIQGDADACAEAGIPIIYCSYGFGTVADPIAVIDKPMDLPDLIDDPADCLTD